MKYLIAGKHGQLAHAFIRRFELSSIDYIAPEESELNITDESGIMRVVSAVRPDVIINCAAFNLVDKAEEQAELAHSVNAAGPEKLARAAAEQHAVLVHFSSDYVFDGQKEQGLYTEQDTPNPLNVYGKSKLSGERAVEHASERNLILRLSWVYGAGKQNFVYKFSQWAETGTFLKIACDEFSVPTSTETVVDVTLKALDRGLAGRYHVTNSGFCSRYEWAKVILRHLNKDTFIRPVPMGSFHLPARRPLFSAMANDLISRSLDITIPTWEEAVQSYMRQGGIFYDAK